MSEHSPAYSPSRKERYLTKIAFQRRQLEAFVIDDLGTNVSASDYREKVFSLYMKLNRIPHINLSFKDKYAIIDFALPDDDLKQLCLLELKSRETGKPFGDIPFYSIESSKVDYFKNELQLRNGFKHFLIVYEFCYNGTYEYYVAKYDPSRVYEIKLIRNRYNGKLSKKYKIPVDDYVKLDMDNLKAQLNNLLLD